MSATIIPIGYTPDPAFCDECTERAHDGPCDNPRRPAATAVGSDRFDASDGYIGREGLTVAADLRAWWERYIVVLHPRDHDLLTLWTLHTHVLDHMGTTPRLEVTSPLPDAGKTTVLEHLQRLAFAPVSLGVVTTPAMISRLLVTGVRTLLIDEVDRNLKPDRPGVEDLLAILNVGYKRGSTRPTLVPDKDNGWRVEELPTFAPVVMAGRSPILPMDTVSRMLSVVLLPDAEGVAEDSDWEEIEAPAAALVERIAAWAASVENVPKPDLPASLRGRAKERWRPLWRVAHLLGGDWPDRCRALIENEADRLAHDKEDGSMQQVPAVALLHDIAAEFPPGATHWATQAVCDALRSRYPDRWGPTAEFQKGLTVQRIGRYLGRNFNIQAARSSSGERLGYAREDIDTLCRRLGIPQTDAEARHG